MDENLPNIAQTEVVDGQTVEPNAPVNTNPGSGGTTFPSSAGGNLNNTGISSSNLNLAHICDFSSNIQKDTQLKQFLISQAQTIKDAKREVMLALGASDATGSYQWLVEDLQAVTRGLKYLQKNVIQPILDFEKLVIRYISKLKQIIAYILTLPARILKLLATCIKDLEKSIASVFTDSATGGSTSNSSDLTAVIEAAKQTGAALSQVTKQTIQAAGQAVAIVGTATKVVAPLTRNTKLP